MNDTDDSEYVLYLSGVKFGFSLTPLEQLAQVLQYSQMGSSKTFSQTMANDVYELVYWVKYKNMKWLTNLSIKQCKQKYGQIITSAMWKFKEDRKFV